MSSARNNRVTLALCFRLLLWPAAFTAGLLPAGGVLFYSTGDPAFNTTPPTGALEGSGWQYVGQFGGFQGTVISSNCFITAQHIGGNIGDKFVFNGVNYPVIAAYPDPKTDLQIWRVCGQLPTSAPLYTNHDELGKNLVVIGRGTQRGDEVRVNDSLKGWKWGPGDGIQRWGENTVAHVYLEGTTNALSGPGIPGGDFLSAEFDRTGGTNEAHLSSGDSGGPVFIAEGGVWKLAGICYAVDGPFNTTNSGGGFEAALFDAGGLYYPQGTNWILIPDRFLDATAEFYASRISTRMDWIQQVLQAAAADFIPVLESAPNPQGPYGEETSAVLDPVLKQFTVSATGDTKFYRIRSCNPVRINELLPQPGGVIIRYN